MPIEMSFEISKDEKVGLPSIFPNDDPASITDTAGNIFVVGCKPDDSGGYVQIVDEKETDLYAVGNKRIIDINKVENTVYILPNEEHRVLLSRPNNIIGELVVRHISPDDPKVTIR